jgi:hypothetical protein
MVDDIRYVQGILVGRPEHDCFDGTGLDGKIILKCVLRGWSRRCGLYSSGSAQ